MRQNQREEFLANLLELVNLVSLALEESVRIVGSKSESVSKSVGGVLGTEEDEEDEEVDEEDEEDDEDDEEDDILLDRQQKKM